MVPSSVAPDVDSETPFPELGVLRPVAVKSCLKSAPSLLSPAEDGAGGDASLCSIMELDAVNE